MGSGRWDPGTYTSRVSAKVDAGKPIFDYGDTMRSTMSHDKWKVHESLDPKKTNKNGPHAGQNIREAYDNDEHPESLAIAVMFDVTGSMGQMPRVLQKKLPDLHSLLMRKMYVEHPQILFGAIGDATCDRVPLQVGEFESDNRMDEHLENILIESGGGGQVTESYELAMYMMARHTDMDCFNKRNKKGYLFLMGDEQPYPYVKKDEVRAIIGDDLQSNIPIKEIADELMQKFEVFYLYVQEGSYSAARILPPWKELFGERALVLEKADAVCEFIALTLAVLEGAVTYEDGLEDIKEVSPDATSVMAAGKALAAVGGGSAPLAKSSEDLPGMEGESGTDRL